MDKTWKKWNKQFCYLGSLVTEDIRSGREVRRRIALGKEAFNKKKDLMQKSLSLHLQKRMVKVFVWSVVLYGSETWTLVYKKRIFSDLRHWNVDMKAYDESIMDWAQNKWRSVANGRRRKRNDDDTLRSRQKRWLGHILRDDSLVRNVRRTNTREKGCGRPRTMFLDWLLKTGEDNISYDELKMLAQDRLRWKPNVLAEYSSSSYN